MVRQASTVRRVFTDEILGAFSVTLSFLSAGTAANSLDPKRPASNPSAAARRDRRS